MSINENQLQFIINCDVEQIVFYLNNELGISLADAFSIVYHSQVYKKLININTGLYLQSAEYLYDRLLEEMQPLTSK